MIDSVLNYIHSNTLAEATVYVFSSWACISLIAICFVYAFFRGFSSKR